MRGGWITSHSTHGVTDEHVACCIVGILLADGLDRVRVVQGSDRLVQHGVEGCQNEQMKHIEAQQTNDNLLASLDLVHLAPCLNARLYLHINEK